MKDHRLQDSTLNREKKKKKKGGDAAFFMGPAPRLDAGGRSELQRVQVFESRSCLHGTYWHSGQTRPYFFQRMPQALHSGSCPPMSRHNGVLVT